MFKVMIAGGGTAGHINPGIAIAKYIQQKMDGVEILFVGTDKGLEKNLVPREGFELATIRVMGFKRKLSTETFKAVKELFNGLLDARKILKKYKPDFVIGTGGYVCGPLLFMASRMKIPTLVHEQNAFPGVTNRILSKFVDTVAISFKESKEYFKQSKNIVFTGNPIRSELIDMDRSRARENLKLSGESQLLLVFGGSRGAEKVNQTVVEMLQRFYKEDFEVIFATGEAQYDKVMKALEGFSSKKVRVVPYIFDMANVLASADLVLSRAGAITVSELAAVGVPSVLVPSPFVTANHQEHNARALEVQGAAVVVLEKNLSAELLHQQLRSLLGDKEQLNKMARSAKKVGITNATERIFSIIKQSMH